MTAGLLLLQRLAETADGLLRGGYLLVMDGEGFEELPETLPLRSGANARVVRVDSELALRHALWKARPSAVVAVIPEALDLPADLRQGAERRRVHTLSGDEVLSALLGTRVTGVDDAELRALAIEHAAQIQARLHAKTTPTVIDRPLLERTLLEVVAELHDLRAADGRLGDLLARWILAPPNWTLAVRRLAAATLAQHHGDAGRVLAWALEDAPERCPALLIHGALLGVEGEVPVSGWGPLATLREEDGSPLRAPALADRFVVQLANDAAARLGHAARPYLDRADTLARKVLGVKQLQTSSLLPLAFEGRAHTVATALAGGEVVPRESFRALRSHALAITAERQLDLLDDLDRLTRYLRHPEVEGAGAVELAQAYLADHAHADRCARRVERALASVPAHHAEARAVLAKVYAARNDLNLRYARSLASRYVPTLFDRGVVALQNVVRDVLCERRAEPNASRVFLLVLDGCSAPVFLDLIDQLTGPDHKVGLERGAGMSLRMLTGLSPLPTITSHARGALFLGAVPKDPFALETQWHEDGERVTDPARFKQNTALKDTERRLFLKRDLADGGAALQAALRGPLPVVAAVFNAVDDRISSHDTGAAWRMEVEDVTGLLPALQSALDTGRKVLFTADHGHTPFRGTELRVEGGKTPRYVRLAAKDPVPDGFIEIDCADLAGEPGRTAFAWRSGVYRGQVQVGFHGGCSLEEMVVPVAWLARDGATADQPAWWDGGGPLVAPAAPPASPPNPPAATSRPALSLLAGVDQIHLLGLPEGVANKLGEDEKLILVLLKENGSARATELADRLKKNPGRLNGLMRTLRRTLHADGLVLFADEVLPTGETLYRFTGGELS